MIYYYIAGLTIATVALVYLIIRLSKNVDEDYFDERDIYGEDKYL